MLNDYSSSPQSHPINTINNLEEFKNAMMGSPDHVIITNPDGIIIYANPAVTKTTGYASSEIIGTKAGTLWGGLMDKEFYTNMWNTIKNKKEIFKGEVTNKRKDGTKYNAHVKIIPILDDQLEVSFFIGIEDIVDKGLEDIGNLTSDQVQEIAS